MSNKDSYSGGWTRYFGMPFLDQVAAGMVERAEPLSFGGNILSVESGFGEVRFDESKVPFFLKQGQKLTVTAESTSGTVAEASFGMNGYIILPPV
jgi:hypothetical protein